MNDKEIDKIEQEIFISLKDKIINLSSKEAEKIIEEEAKKEKLSTRRLANLLCYPKNYRKKKRKIY